MAYRLRWVHGRLLGAAATVAMFAMLGANAVCSSPQGARQGRPASVPSPSGPKATPLADAASAMADASGATESGETAPRQGAGASSGACGDGAVERSIGSESAPSQGWWNGFVRAQARPRARPAFPRVAAPRVAMQIHGLDSSNRVFRAYRQQWGRFRMCHERALGAPGAADAGAGGSRSEGHWVARVRQDQTRVCTVDVVESAVSDEMSACLVAAVRAFTETGSEAGTLEVVLTFNVP